MRIAAFTIITVMLLAFFSPEIQGFALGNEMVVSAQTEEPLFSKNLFNADLLYAYVQSGARTAVAIVNFTKVPNITLSNYSGVTEVYTVQVFSGGNLVSRTTKIGGIIGSGIASGVDLINLGMDGSFWASTNVSLETFTIDYKLTDYPILNEPISVSLIRLGWITTQDHHSEIHFASQDQELVKHAELTTHNEGFLYNTLLSQDQLARLDPFKPLSSYITTPIPSSFSNETKAPGPSIIREFSAQSAFISVIVIVIFIVAISLFSASLYLHKKRRLQS